MKILITESQLKDLSELSGQFKEETEIIYRDNNIICLIPKSQMSAKMYGKGTHWCSTGKCGFDTWSSQGLLVRFIFRGGKKIRFTYLFKTNYEGDFNWANENGYHTLKGIGNPFDVQPTGSKYENELDVYNHIKLIPDECKKRVLEFIEKNRREYNYIYKKEQFEFERIKKNNKLYSDFYKNYSDSLYHVGIYFYYDRDLNRFEINSTGEESEYFKNFESFIKRITKIYKERKNEPISNNYSIDDEE
jgi:hypothetical protein